MKKQDIKVRINNDAEAKEVRDLLLEAGERIDTKHQYTNEYNILVYFRDDKDWFFTKEDIVRRDLEISIQQLREMLHQKQTVTIEVNAHDLPAIELVLLELSKAREKHPIWIATPHYSLSILTEEVGEVAKDVNDGKDIRGEVSQTAAVCLRILSGV